MLPYFLRHYETFVDRIVVYDNGSSDGSREIVMSHPLCELRELFSDHGNEDNLLWVKSESWKHEAQGSPGIDWVIACDIDEMLYHSDPRAYLQKCQQTGVTLPQIRGFEMVSEKFPTKDSQLTRLCQRGFPRALYAKRIVFSPSGIKAINYSPGCHSVAPEGLVLEDNTGELVLLHYGSLGRDRLLHRRAAMSKRNSVENRERGFWRHNDQSEEEFNRSFSHFVALAEPCLFLGFRSITIRDVVRWSRRAIRRVFGKSAERPIL